MTNKYTELIDRIAEAFPFTKSPKIEIEVSEKDMTEFHNSFKELLSGENVIQTNVEITEKSKFTGISNWNGHLIINHNGE